MTSTTCLPTHSYVVVVLAVNLYLWDVKDAKASKQDTQYLMNETRF